MAFVIVAAGMSPDKPATRLLPSHFVSLWMVDLPSHPAGRPGDLGWALAWMLVAAILAWAVILGTSRVAHRPCWRARPGSVRDQLAATVRIGWRDWRRNRVLWALLVVVPGVFIWLADAITPDGTTRLALLEHGRRVIATFNPADIHGGTMTPIAIASLAALAGLFVALDARGDQRLVLPGQRGGAARRPWTQPDRGTGACRRSGAGAGGRDGLGDAGDQSGRAGRHGPA